MSWQEIICLNCDRVSTTRFSLCVNCWQNLKDEEMAWDEQYNQEGSDDEDAD